MLLQQLIVLLEEHVTLNWLIFLIGKFVGVLSLELSDHGGESARAAEVFQLVHKSLDGKSTGNLLKIAPDSVHVYFIFLLLLGLH